MRRVHSTGVASPARICRDIVKFAKQRANGDKRELDIFAQPRKHYSQ